MASPPFLFLAPFNVIKTCPPARSTCHSSHSAWSQSGPWHALQVWCKWRTEKKLLRPPGVHSGVHWSRRKKKSHRKPSKLKKKKKKRTETHTHTPSLRVRYLKVTKTNLPKVCRVNESYFAPWIYLLPRSLQRETYIVYNNPGEELPVFPSTAALDLHVNALACPRVH